MENELPVTDFKKAAGAAKCPMHVAPVTSLIQLNGVMAGGEHKYGFANYRDASTDALTYIGAINRHFMLWQDGVDTDKESGFNHLAHIMACCAILIDAQVTDTFNDSRSKTGLVEQMLEDSAKVFKEFKEKTKGK